MVRPNALLDSAQRIANDANGSHPQNSGDRPDAVQGMLVATSVDRIVKLWNLIIEQLVRTLHRHMDQVYKFCCCLKGFQVCATGYTTIKVGTVTCQGIDFKKLGTY